MALRFDARERGPDRVVIAENVTIAVGERELVRDFSATLMRGDVVGLVGPNGSGKSTLLRALMGEHPVAAGTLRVGSALDVAYYRQDMAQVPLDKSLYDVIAGIRPLWERRQVQGHLGRFGFSGDEVQRRAGTLSGGERARVALAMLTLGGSNLLLLDEPTNHLDVESIEALEDALEAYGGSVLLVSHDRELLRALTTRVWVLYDRHITDFHGSFAEWEVVAAERAHAASVRASEAEALRRVKERQTVRRERPERELRRAQKRMQESEAEIARLESRIATVSALLEDPELYTRPAGVDEATRLGAELEDLRTSLDAALLEWTEASEMVEDGAEN